MPLQLAVKQEYFDQIKAGTKTEEYRLCTPYWERRLNHAHVKFGELIITSGYPKRGDPERTLSFPYVGWSRKTITHPHFGPDPVEVFAIKITNNAEISQ